MAGDHRDHEVLLSYEADVRPTLQHRLHSVAGQRRQVETLQISDELNIDIAPDGRVYGIELLNANAQLRAQDDGQLIVRNEAAGEERTLPLAQP